MSNCICVHYGKYCRLTLVSGQGKAEPDQLAKSIVCEHEICGIVKKLLQPIYTCHMYILYVWHLTVKSFHISVVLTQVASPCLSKSQTQYMFVQLNACLHTWEYESDLLSLYTMCLCLYVFWQYNVSMSVCAFFMCIYCMYVWKWMCVYVCVTETRHWNTDSPIMVTEWTGADIRFQIGNLL